MTNINPKNACHFNYGIVWVLLLLLAYSIAGAQTRTRSYTVTPSRLEQGNEYELTIKSVNCSSNDLLGADLVAPKDSGIRVAIATGVHDCTMIARVVVAKNALVNTAVLRIIKQGSDWGLINLSIVPGLISDSPTTSRSNEPPAAANPSPETANPSPAANPSSRIANPLPGTANPLPGTANPSPAVANSTPVVSEPSSVVSDNSPARSNSPFELAVNNSLSLTEREKLDAVRMGLNAKGGFTGLNISDTGRGIANALIAMGNNPRNTTSGTGFSLALYTPRTWIAQQASNAAKRYEKFTVESITPDMMSPVLRVIVHPDTPTRISAAGMANTSSVEHVVLRDEAKTLVVQPNSVRPFSETVSSALRDVSYQGLEVTFLLSSVNELRGPKGEKEFLVVVIGNGRTERTFKIKKKHFERLPYDVVVQ